MANDDDETLKQRVDGAQDTIGGKKAKAKARFFGMADRIEKTPSKYDDLREKLNRIRQHVKSTEDAE
jgi:hypothetical protein